MYIRGKKKEEWFNMSRSIDQEKIIVIIIVFLLLAGGGMIFWNNISNQQSGEALTSTNLIDTGDNINQQTQSKKSIIVHIAGEVKKPGVYKLNEDSRIIDAVKMAGGETSAADLNNLNLAGFLADGEKVIVPGINKSSDINDKIQGNDMKENKTKININQADIADLIQLTGIGESKAQNIINYRNQINGFEKIQEIINVNGIGERTLENIKDELTI